jgi:hypothetical protein
MVLPNLSEIDGATIRTLVDNCVAEQRSLDYKERLPGGSDADKKEFLADVASLANTGGGYVVFGIADRRDTEGRSTGEPDHIVGLASINADQEKLRLDQVIRTSIDPRVAGVEWKLVDDLGGDGPVLVLHVPRSFRAPHMVTFKGSSRFFARSSAGKYQLDVDEIRSAFLTAESVPERIRDFRADRLARIEAGETPMPLDRRGGVLVLHVVPLTSIVGTSGFDLAAAAGSITTALPPIRTSSWNHRYNLDGFFTYSEIPERGTHAYNLCFRNGRVEVVDTFLLHGHQARDTGPPIIPSLAVAEEVHDSLANILKLYKAQNVEPPVVVMLTLLGVAGYELATGAEVWRDPYRSHEIDRAALLLSEVVIDHLDADVRAATHPILDELWQASGWGRVRGGTGQGAPSVSPLRTVWTGPNPVPVALRMRPGMLPCGCILARGGGRSRRGLHPLSGLSLVSACFFLACSSSAFFSFQASTICAAFSSSRR